ncbi:MAG: hypothetical protein MK212_18705, partial [Saprospiraceae bacterium]|nr:hypothetical protein [Saprospiraceae bacterium]
LPRYIIFTELQHQSYIKKPSCDTRSNALKGRGQSELKATLEGSGGPIADGGRACQKEGKSLTGSRLPKWLRVFFSFN